MDSLRGTDDAIIVENTILVVCAQFSPKKVLAGEWMVSSHHYNFKEKRSQTFENYPWKWHLERACTEYGFERNKRESFF
ncbi:74903898-97cf-443f-a66f-5345b0e3c2e7 [Sclerotinia trifoliorum]|uniref:74903898-97cf-443f-a66f-5345b0e3c2e7 n=1 Tax=Sclerotinia trifoliorum TaxID=28548 RepID=A0A8H2ZQK6_9HELO|nr:74903898-97cf-443f-a66f-5345b0e3c2e7 [Sclerotinia trifoliorum]